MLLLLLGVWGALVPLVGPYVHFGYTPVITWHLTAARFWFHILPGVTVTVGGLLLLEAANRVITSVGALHDLGVAAWFGGSLMGATGVNGAANNVTDRTDRTRVASAGWARWAPVNAAAIGAHLLGGLGLLLANRECAAHHRGVRASTSVKLGLTAGALATTAYSGVLGARIVEAGQAPSEGAVVPDASTPPDVTKAQKQQRILQWATPALTGAIVVLSAQQSEQQRPVRRLAGAGDSLRTRAHGLTA